MAIETLPRWDMTTVFPSLDSPEFDGEMRSVIDAIGNLGTLFDDLHIGKTEHGTVDAATVHAFDTIMERYAALMDRIITLNAYITAFVATDSRDDRAQARYSEMAQHLVRLSQLQTRFVAWLGSLDVDALIERSPIARDHTYMLHVAAEGARHLMPQPEENLASELNLSGGDAWERLHSNVSSQLMVPITLGGEEQTLPMSEVRNLAMSPDREVRRAAYEAELAAWQRVAVPLAAALNGIKGETNTLDEHRGWPSALDMALFNNHIDRATLDAMMSAAREAFPDFRRYLRAKARALGVDRLPWYDISAPLGASERRWDWDDAVRFMLDQFGAYSPRLRDFASGALGQRWIDAEPRAGKEGGGFCMGVRPGESRILINFTPSYDAMSTLAHELGHAYHNYNLANRDPFQRRSPMILAETASIFCETIVREAALAHADEPEELAIIESSLQGSTQVVVDITSRFIFESTLFERRREREQSIDELNAMMLDSQKQTYGDGLDENVLHPYMWAVKSHYYSVDRPFYNYPYMFGLLFGLGLYALYEQDPDAFRARYDELLSSTGIADAATLAARFGFDIRTPAFWTASFDIIRRQVDRFEELVNKGVAGS